MDTHEIIHEEEKTQIVEAFKKLQELVSDTMSHDDTRKVKEILEEAVKDGALQRGSFDLNPILFDLQTAIICAEEIGLNRASIISILLQDSVSRGSYPIERVGTEFGSDVEHIIRGLIKVNELYDKNPSIETENFRDLLLSFAEDMRVIFIIIADRVNLMRQIKDRGTEEERKRVATEASYLYAPLAHKLGLYLIKSELEDLSLKYLEHDAYYHIKDKLNETKRSRDRYIANFIKPIEEKLAAAGLKFHVKGRTKSIHSIWQKMKKQKCQFEGVYDLFAIRVILDSPLEREKADCWQVYSIVTDMYKPNPKRLRDWLSVPKTNGYESLHTTVMGPEGKWVEVQIRTERMDVIAEKGMAAHFLYKEAHPEEKLELSPVEVWLQQIRTSLENPEKNALDLVEEFKEALYIKEIYLFTPKGEMIKLPAHSTVLDFAFAIHTNLGVHCMGAKVNGKVEPINYTLRAGEQVQILTSRKTRPSEEWLGMAYTSHAKEAIKNNLKKQRKGYLEEGKMRLKEILKSLRIPYSDASIGQVKRFLGLKSDIDLFFQLAMGITNHNDIAQCFGKGINANHNTYFMGEYTTLFDKDSTAINRSTSSTGSNQRSFLLDEEYERYATEPAPCCKPVQGDHVVGIVTDGKIMVHRTNCKVAMDEMANHENHIVRARWRPGEHVALLSGIAFTAIDRKGLLQDITGVVTGEMDLNMRAITLEAVEGIVRGIIMLYVLNLENLNHLIENLEKLEGIEEVRRL